MKINKSILFTALMLTTLLCWSCFYGIKGSGRVVKSERTVDPFESIAVSAGIDVILSQDSVVKIIVEADDNLQEIIKTEVSNGKLKIYPEEGIRSCTAKRVYVTMKNIRSLTASSGSAIKSEGELRLNSFGLTVSSGATVNMNLACNSLTVEGSSGGEIKLQGRSESLDVDASSGVSVKMSDFQSKTCNAGASSGATLRIFASESIRAKASSGANIQVTGNPHEQNVEKSSGGSVSFN